MITNNLKCLFLQLGVGTATFLKKAVVTSYHLPRQASYFTKGISKFTSKVRMKAWNIQNSAFSPPMYRNITEYLTFPSKLMILKVPLKCTRCRKLFNNKVYPKFLSFFYTHSSKKLFRREQINKEQDFLLLQGKFQQLGEKAVEYQS